MRRIKLCMGFVLYSFRAPLGVLEHTPPHKRGLLCALSWLENCVLEITPGKGLLELSGLSWKILSLQLQLGLRFCPVGYTWAWKFRRTWVHCCVHLGITASFVLGVIIGAWKHGLMETRVTTVHETNRAFKDSDRKSYRSVQVRLSDDLLWLWSLLWSGFDPDPNPVCSRSTNAWLLESSPRWVFG